jgi:hypothetical protein
VGDPFATEICHEVAVGMGGIRTAGDLVLRLQLAKGLKINAAKKYVADKLGITPLELCDSTVMSELREKLNIGRMQPTDGVAIGMEAKIRIARLLDIKINSVERFRERAGM